uniref:Secreted protein n=1 Tax=Globodera rostochiensis TaxID=31243 RepID=A0A914IAE2_GLORO
MRLISINRFLSFSLHSLVLSHWLVRPSVHQQWSSADGEACGFGQRPSAREQHPTARALVPCGAVCVCVHTQTRKFGPAAAAAARNEKTLERTKSTGREKGLCPCAAASFLPPASRAPRPFHCARMHALHIHSLARARDCGACRTALPPALLWEFFRPSWKEKIDTIRQQKRAYCEASTKAMIIRSLLISAIFQPIIIINSSSSRRCRHNNN